MQPNIPPEHSSSPASADLTELSRRLALLPANEVAQELEQVLGAMTLDTYDAAVIDAYLDELDRKAPMPEPPEEAAAWDAFQKHSNPASAKDTDCVPAELHSAPRRRKLRRVPFLAAALIACMLMTLVVAQAAGGDLLHAIISWTDETFNLSGNGNANDPIQSPMLSEELTELSDAVDQLGITEPVMPHILPEGYTQVEFDYYPDMPCITAVYVSGDNNILVNIISSKDGTVSYQKNPGDPEIYKANGLTFYIMKNVDVYTAAWLTDHYCCSIANVADKDMLYEMINSVW